jgi:nucleoside-specific outer membrane channel protein Tsx
MKRDLALKLVVAALVALAPGPSRAEGSPPSLEVKPRTLLQWSVFDFQYLYGMNWNLGSRRKDIITFQHADGWIYGDNYLFVDVSNVAARGAPTGIYGEWQPRLSFPKLAGKNLDGLVSDILATNRLAFGGGGFFAHLHGLAIDLRLPGFAFFHQHVFARNDVSLSGVTWQITTEWQIPFQIGRARFVQDGFLHLIGPEGSTRTNFITQPRLLLDVGRFAGYENQLLMGIELDARYNTFGLPGKKELVAQAMAQWKL